jgi:hypothetical protein
MHLAKEPVQTPIDRRLIANTINYHLSENDFAQRKISPAAMQLLRCRPSIDSCASNGTIIKRQL